MSNMGPINTSANHVKATKHTKSIKRGPKYVGAKTLQTIAVFSMKNSRVQILYGEQFPQALCVAPCLLLSGPGLHRF